MIGVGSISPAALKARLDGPEPPALLDVREDHERAFCAIPDAVCLHVPMGQVPSRIDEIAALSGPLVVYCHHGVRSMAVVQWLASRGVRDLLNLEGGIDAWSVAVDPGVRRY